MSVFRCEICDKYRDADFVGCHEWGDGLVCEPCYDEEFEKQKAEHEPSYSKAAAEAQERANCYACATQRYSCEHD